MNLSNTTIDPETRSPSLLGYPRLAEVYADDPDCETLVFRKFDELSARNLLRMQSSMLSLESKLKDLDHAMCSGKSPDRWRTLLDYQAMERHAENLMPEEEYKQNLEKEVTSKMKEYHEALLLQSQIVGLHRPSKRLLKALKDVFDQKILVIDGGQQIIDEPSDLITLRPPLDMDLLSHSIRKYWIGRSKVLVGADNRTRHFLESSVQRIVIIISTIFAAILLVGAITTLFFVRKTGAKLGILAGCTTLFAASVGGLTSAKRQEVFAATAAYAAVLVVFVSGDFGQDRGG